MRRALNDREHTYTVYIQHRVLARWLDDLRDYPFDLIDWRDIDLLDRFRDKFGFHPPIDLNDAAIKDLNLLDLPLPTKAEADDPIGWILGHHLDPVWKYSQPYKGHLANLASWVVKNTQIPDPLKPLATKRLSSWCKADPRYQIFLDQPWLIAGESILLRWALRMYPNDFNLRQQLDLVPLEDCQHHTQSVSEVLEKYKTDLNRFWKSWLWEKPLQDVLITTKMMSGLVFFELSILENWLLTNPDKITHSLLDTIRNRFANLPQVDAVIKRLEVLIAPPLPQTPDKNWSTEQWLTWATEEYMPYFAWTIRHYRHRDSQIEMAGYFADWLIAAYPSLIFEPNAPVIIHQQNYLRQLLEDNQTDVIFWLIIDGLTWWQGRRLTESYSNLGLGVTQLGPHLSALPSITSISKRALVQGYLDQNTEKQPIARLLGNQPSRSNRSFYIYTQISAFEQALASNLEPGEYVLFYNSLDQYSHETQGFSDDESVDGHLRLLTRLTNTGFQQCARQGLRAKALISSDHGSTLLPQNTRVLDVPYFAQAIEDENSLEDDNTDKNLRYYQRTRTCTIGQNATQEELLEINEDWYLLRKDTFNLPTHFLIPRGYAAVKRRPRGWTHGGATPEETIVPFFEVQPHPIEIVPPVVKFEGFLTPAQTSLVQITIINPNSTTLRTVRLNLFDFQELLEWPIIGGNSQVIYSFDAQAADSKGKHKTIEWLLTCDTGGRHQQFSGQVNIPIRRFQISEVDEMFEDLT